jgi:hypothetical protein
MMGISTKKGDSGYTSLLRGARVPKHHLIIEAGGSLDEANSLFILKYLNRLSDLIFLLACFEEKDEEEKREINRTLLSPKGVTPFNHKWGIAIGLTILGLIAAIIFLLLFHNANPRATYPSVDKHMEQMENMHKSIEN